MTATAADNRHELLRIQGLLDRLDPVRPAPCTVPGCVHVDHQAETAVELRPAA